MIVDQELLLPLAPVTGTADDFTLTTDMAKAPVRPRAEMKFYAKSVCVEEIWVFYRWYTSTPRSSMRSFSREAPAYVALIYSWCSGSRYGTGMGYAFTYAIGFQTKESIFGL